jgi:hypothetical protein
MMDGVLAQERVREHWDRQPCDSELSAREPTSRDFYLDVERQRYALQPHILERHRQLHRERGSMSREEWLSRNPNGPDYPYCRVYDAREAEELLAGFEILRHEVRFFDHRHWGVLGRLLPPWLRRALGRRWGWHRILHVRKSSTPSAGVEACS